MVSGTSGLNQDLPNAEKDKTKKNYCTSEPLRSRVGSLSRPPCPTSYQEYQTAHCLNAF